MSDYMEWHHRGHIALSLLRYVTEDGEVVATIQRIGDLWVASYGNVTKRFIDKDHAKAWCERCHKEES